MADTRSSVLTDRETRRNQKSKNVIMSIKDRKESDEENRCNQIILHVHEYLHP